MTSDMHPEDIKAAVRKAGVTMAALARTAGLSRQVLSMCLHSRVSEHGDKIIAQAVGKTPHEIWPSRYRRNGQRIRFACRKLEREAA